jgi:hypothetical protein
VNDQELQYHIHSEISYLISVARIAAILESKESMDELRNSLYRLGKLQIRFMDSVENDLQDGDF